MHAVITAGLLYSRLRSRDFLAWLNVFQTVVKKTPFLEAHWASDLKLWKLSYLVEVCRASDVTLEFAHYRKPGRQQRRNHELAAPLEVEWDTLVRAFKANSQKEAAAILMTLEEFGDFVTKNVLVMTSFCEEASWQPLW